MATLAVPSTTSASRRPLSTHGMPKPPRVTSPDRPHRFSGRGISVPEASAGYMSPRTPGPMSPPMSARSIGTFIDSEPSTPAYSPRMDHDWDNSTLVLLRPMSTCSEPGSPSEPVWEMMKPMENTQQAPLPLRIDRKPPTVFTREMAPAPRIASPPTKRSRIPSERKVSIQQETVAPVRKVEHAYKEQKEEGTEESMLRRKSTSDKKKEKKEKEKDYYDPVEDVHWTEM
ncbi:hypothetical protein IQ06DRAFT_35504 [Phaeosphaeriaceae sp. SRC1lsM3a]|nr:hypothetical protein IQ06DRAFT_35504 [Stagonospora sp. SRC1lsM3a]